MLKKLLVIIFIFLTINNTNAWVGLIAENGDLLNIYKWNELVNNKLSISDLKAGGNVILTNSGSEIYINTAGSSIPYISTMTQEEFAKAEVRIINLTGYGFTPTTIVSTDAGIVNSINISNPTKLSFELEAGNTTGIYDIVISNNGTLNTLWTDNGKNLIRVNSTTVYNSCKEIIDSGESIGDGNYILANPNGGTYSAYCDMTTDGGGWTRVVRTDSNNQEWGQKTDNYTYAQNTDDIGIYDAYRYLNSFSQTMLKQVDTNTFASYDLVSTSTDSIYDLMSYCKGQSEKHSDDSAWDGARLKGMTSEYSGLKVAGTMSNVDYFFMCGVNEDSDNDQSYLTFARSSGQIGNGYGDSWRGVNQTSTTWSLLNNDYYTASNTHIGNGQSQAGAGYKSDGTSGYYEVYIK